LIVLYCKWGKGCELMGISCIVSGVNGVKWRNVFIVFEWGKGVN
jgi:hypothetical protein